MTLIVSAFTAVVVCSTVAAAADVLVPCSAGARVYSLSVWSSWWVNGVVMRCTGDDEEEVIPPDFNDHPGGVEEGDICAGTGGVKSIEWGVPDTSGHLMVYFNITCMDNETYHFAHGRPYEAWNITENRAVSCEDGEHVQGVTYDVTIVQNSSVPCFLTSIGFMCSSSTLDSLCTGCSGDSTMKSEKDQPEYCELSSCSEAECCDPNVDEAESIAVTVIIGVVTTVVAAVIISGSAWMFNKLRKKDSVNGGVNDFLGGGHAKPQASRNVTTGAVPATSPSP